MTYEALNNKLIIRPKELETKLENGITIQESRGKKDILVGEVILSPLEEIPNSIGLGNETIKYYKIKPGTLVWYPEYASLPITLDGERLSVIDYEDIILKGE